MILASDSGFNTMRSCSVNPIRQFGHIVASSGVHTDSLVRLRRDGLAIRIISVWPFPFSASSLRFNGSSTLE